MKSAYSAAQIAVILEPRKVKSDTVSTVSPSISHKVDGELREPLMWRQGSQVSMRMARGSVSLLSSSQLALVVKNPPANAGDIRDVGLIPG